MASLWFNAAGILHDGIGLVLCDTCPCVDSSSVFSDSSLSSSASCPPGCFVVNDPYVILDEQDPVQYYDVTFTLNKTIVCPGESVNVVIDISEIGVGAGAFAPQLGLSTSTSNIALSNLTPYDATTDDFLEGSISGFSNGSPILLQYDQFGSPPREISQISFDLTLSNDDCLNDTIEISVNTGREIHFITLSCCPEG